LGEFISHSCSKANLTPSPSRGIETELCSSVNRTPWQSLRTIRTRIRQRTLYPSPKLQATNQRYLHIHDHISAVDCFFYGYHSVSGPFFGQESPPELMSKLVCTRLIICVTPNKLLGKQVQNFATMEHHRLRGTSPSSDYSLYRGKVHHR